MKKYDIAILATYVLFTVLCIIFIVALTKKSEKTHAETRNFLKQINEKELSTVVIENTDLSVNISREETQLKVNISKGFVFHSDFEGIKLSNDTLYLKTKLINSNHFIDLKVPAHTNVDIINAPNVKFIE